MHWFAFSLRLNSVEFNNILYSSCDIYNQFSKLKKRIIYKYDTRARTSYIDSIQIPKETLQGGYNKLNVSKVQFISSLSSFPVSILQGLIVVGGTSDDGKMTNHSQERTFHISQSILSGIYPI